MNETTLPRRIAREIAFQYIYSLNPEERNLDRESFSLFCNTFSLQCDDFAWELASGTISNFAEVNESIALYSKNWRIERMPRVDLTILRLGAFEILRRSDIPKSVTINEAVELAKKFGAEGSASFVNGLLDKIQKPA